LSGSFFTVVILTDASQNKFIFLIIFSPSHGILHAAILHGSLVDENAPVLVIIILLILSG
jgi:hypothetical protein